jgi:hypothetical protein
MARIRVARLPLLKEATGAITFANLAGPSASGRSLAMAHGV